MKYNNDRAQGVKDGFFQNLPNLKKIWRERDIYASCSNSNIEEFVPPENSGTAITEVSLECKYIYLFACQYSHGVFLHFKLKELKKKWSNIGSFGKDKVAIRGIRKYESEFNLKVFLEEAKDVYVKAHECLAA